MYGVKEIVRVIDIVDIAFVCVSPVCWPWVDDLKPIARELEAWPILNNHRTVDDKRVLPTEMLAELRLWNPLAFVGGRRIARLSGMPMFHLLFLCLFGLLSLCFPSLIFLCFLILLLCLLLFLL